MQKYSMILGKKLSSLQAKNATLLKKITSK